MIEDHGTATNSCSSCGKVNDRATDLVTAAKPKAGDVSICIGCGHVAIFTAALALRDPTPQESAELLADKRIIAHQRAVWATRK